jgi:hypothetical protein
MATLEATRHAYSTPVAQWTKEDWLAAGLNWCPQCMSGPWDARFRWDGQGWGECGAEPCPHGTIWNYERLLQVKRWRTIEGTAWAAFWVLVVGWTPFLFKPLIPVFILGLIFFVGGLLYFRHQVDLTIQRFTTTSLIELDGIWMKRHKRTQPWEKMIF